MVLIGQYHGMVGGMSRGYRVWVGLMQGLEAAQHVLMCRNTATRIPGASESLSCAGIMPAELEVSWVVVRLG